MFRFDPKNRKIHPDILLNFLHMALQKCNVSKNEFVYDCKNHDHPSLAVDGVYKAALLLVANTVRYDFDIDCLGRNGEHFEDLIGVFKMLSNLGLDNSWALLFNHSDYFFFRQNMMMHIQSVLAIPLA